MFIDNNCDFNFFFFKSPENSVKKNETVVLFLDSYLKILG